MHYERWRKYGDIDANHRTAPAVDRFWPKVNKDGPLSAYRPDLGPCWLWTGATNAGEEREPYGHFWDGKEQVYSHRFSYETARGPIPAEYDVDHLCRVRLCVNPEHLEPVTRQENLRRARPPLSTHCRAGHEYTPENTSVRASGRRDCRACRKDHWQRVLSLRSAAA